MFFVENFACTDQREGGLSVQRFEDGTASPLQQRPVSSAGTPSRSHWSASGRVGVGFTPAGVAVACACERMHAFLQPDEPEQNGGKVKGTAGVRALLRVKRVSACSCPGLRPRLCPQRRSEVQSQPRWDRGDRPLPARPRRAAAALGEALCFSDGRFPAAFSGKGSCCSHLKCHFSALQFQQHKIAFSGQRKGRYLF